jgi:periplasmic protein TonB
VNTANPVFSLAVSTDWYRQGSVKAAFALSLLVHAAAIALLPGLRIASLEQPAPLVVELVPEAPPDSPAPVVPPQPRPEPAPVVKRSAPLPQSRPEPPPTPAQARPEPVLAAPAQVLREPIPEPAVPELRPEAPPPPAPQAHVAPAPQPSPPEPQVAAKVEAQASPARQVQPSLDVAALKAFGETLAQAIGKRKDYPRLARLRNWQGTTELKLQIGPDGKLLEVHVGHSSGFQVLDAAAIQMVHNAAPLPDVPEALRGRELTMTVPVVFKLEAL